MVRGQVRRMRRRRGERSRVRREFMGRKW